MKKLIITATGGHRRSNHDLVHLQESISETMITFLKGLLASGSTIPNCILYGMQKTVYGNGDVDIAAGACILGGEICLFPFTQIPDGTVLSGQVGVITYDDTYPANNPVVYADASTHYVHLNRKAKFDVASAVGTNQLSWASDVRLNAVLKANLHGDTTWHTVGSAGEPGYQNSFSKASVTVGGAVPAEHDFRFRKTSDNIAILQGQIGCVPIGTTNIPGGGFLICTLPSVKADVSGVAGVYSYNFKATAISQGMIVVCNMQIDHNGNLRLMSYDGSTNPVGVFGGDEELLINTMYSCK